MGDINQFEWIKRHVGSLRGPVLEVGSKQYGANVSHDYRSLLSHLGKYIGTDMAAGPGVDITADLTADFASLPAALRQTQFGTIVCMSVMEHVRDVYKFSANLRRLLADDGIAFISVPWVWRFHGYPSDYWRFSPEALKFLFEPLALNAEASCVSYQQLGRFAPLSADYLNLYPNYEEDTAPTSMMGRWIWKLARRCRTPRQVLYPCMINAVFQRAA